MALDVGRLVAHLELDDAEYKRGLSEAEQRLRQLDATAQQVQRSTRDAASGAGRGLRDLGGDAERASREVEQIGDSAREAERRTRGIEIPSTLTRDAERARREVESIGDAARGAEQQLGGMDVSGPGRDAGGSAGIGFLDSFGDKIGKLSAKGGPIAGSLMGAAALGVAAGALLAKGIADGLSMEQKSADIEAKFGLDAATVGRIGKAAGDSYRNAFGESTSGNMETLAIAMQQGMVSQQATNAEMSKFVGLAETANQVVDGDMNETLRAATLLVANGLVPNVESAFDLIVRGGQAGANVQGDLIDSLKEYSDGWQQAGVSGKLAVAMIDQSLENGVDNSDRASDAIREFGRRMYESGDDIRGTLNTLGLDADATFQLFKNGGEDTEKAFDLVWDSIRNVSDAQERAALTQALLGDTAGDFVNAFGQWDPSAAVAKFGEVSGAAQKASDVMGGTGQASMTSALRSLETAGDGLKASLGQVAAPQLEKLAEWMSEHKPEIIEFFTAVGTGALDLTIAFANFAEGSLRVLGNFNGAVGDIIGGLVGLLADGVGAIGGLIEHVPGMGGIADSMQDAAARGNEMAEQFHDMGQGTLAMADALRDGGIPALEEMRENLANNGVEAANAERLTRALGDTVISMPDGKTITMQSNSPQVAEQLRLLGLSVTTLPNGEFQVTANTAEGQRLVDDFIRVNQTRTVVIPAQLEARYMTIPGGNIALAGLQAAQAAQKADGGIEEPGQARIADRLVYQYGEPETHGEAWIPFAPSKRSRSLAIWAEAGKHLGVLPMADGGILTADELDSRSRGIEGAEYVFGGWGDSWNTDCSGAAARVANLAVYGDPMSGGRFSTANEGEALAARGFLDGPGPDGSLRIGWIDDPNMAGGGHTASTLPNGMNVEMGGARGNGQYGGSAAGALDFPNVMHLPITPSVGAGNGGSFDLSGAPAAPGGGYGALTSSTGTGGVQEVFVTNWPPALGGGERTPIASFSAKMFAGGGIEDHSPQISNAMRIWAEPETGGEAYIPLGPSKRSASLALWAEVGRRLGVAGYAAGGGFGGYTGPDTTDYMKPRNAYDAVALGAGLLFTAASGLSGVASMAGSGTVNLGDLAPQFDTGSNSIPGLEKAMQTFLGEVTTRLDALIKKKESIDLNVDVDTNTGAVNASLARAGIA